MLILSLILSSIFVAILLTMTGSGEPKQRTKVVGWAFLGIPAGLFLCQSAALALNASLVFVASVGGLFGGCSPQAFRRHIWLATVATYLILSVFPLIEVGEIHRLRQAYPLESMAERLAYEKPGTPSVSDQPLTDQTELRLRELESRLTGDKNPRGILFEIGDKKPKGIVFELGARPTGYNLEDLHRSYVLHFIESPGFGLGRMLGGEADYRRLKPDSREIVQSGSLPSPAYDDPIREKDYRDPWGESRTTVTNMPGRDNLTAFHVDGLLNFVNRGDFGYIRNRNEVAGFIPHHFQLPPTLKDESAWQLDTLELVSLLKHAEPMAYVSRELPRMDKLREVPVRPLTGHERTMLDGLRRGEDLQVRSIPDRIRMLGAIRAAEQCLQCHEVARGTLLGAFSYKLRLSP